MEYPEEIKDDLKALQSKMYQDIPYPIYISTLISQSFIQRIIEQPKLLEMAKATILDFGSEDYESDGDVPIGTWVKCPNCETRMVVDEEEYIDEEE